MPQNNIDRMLDSAIASYANQEPLAGLPDRILSRIALSQPAPPRSTSRTFAIGIVAAALATLLLWFARPHTPEKMRTPLAIATATPPSAPPAAVMPPPARHHHLAHARALPKQPLFPTPTPLSPEERRLVALVQLDPEGTAAAFESFRKQSEPLKIEPIKIEPLDNSGGQ